MTHVRITQSGTAHVKARRTAPSLTTSAARTPAKREVRAGGCLGKAPQKSQGPALISEPCTVRAMTTTTARPIIRVDQIG